MQFHFARSQSEDTSSSCYLCASISPFLDINAADKPIADFPNIQRWAVGGHSLGGVAAALYVRDRIDGIVFWASYPADDALKNTNMKTLSIYGTRDMGGMDAFDKSQGKLPADTEFVVIDGGNHGQFGDYGFQPGDNEAAISRAEQQSQTVDATVRFKFVEQITFKLCIQQCMS